MTHDLTPRDTVPNLFRLRKKADVWLPSCCLWEEVKKLCGTRGAHLPWKYGLSASGQSLEVSPSLHCLRGAIWREHVFIGILQYKKRQRELLEGVKREIQRWEVQVKSCTSVLTSDILGTTLLSWHAGGGCALILAFTSLLFPTS